MPVAQPVQYLTQPAQYVDQQGNPVQMASQPVQYVDEQGNPVQMVDQQVQYVDEQGNPIQLDPGMQYVDQFGNPVAMPGSTYAPPAVFNISPEQFALLASGGSLSQAEVDGLLGTQGALPTTETLAV